MEGNVELEKWGFSLQELYRMALQFYKQNSGKALHLSYEDNLKLIAFKQQASLGAFDPKYAPELGVLDVIGRDRRLHWQMLGNINREQAMEGFINLLDTMCSAFRPYVEAVRKNREETLKDDLKRMEEEKLENEKHQQQQQELLEVYKEEIQRRHLQDALNKQTYQQFKAYAERQFPGNPEQQAVLVHQLQQEHYHQYMQQLHLQSPNIGDTKSTNNGTVTLANDKSVKIEQHELPNELAQLTLNNKPAPTLPSTVIPPSSLSQEQNQQQQQQTISDDEDYVIIQPAKIWTRPDIEEFKVDVSAGDGDGVLTVGHGDTVTVRVPTNINGKCIFWEFATDNYDIGFGIYFEWSKPVSQEVTVHISESDDDDEFLDDDYLSTNEDLEYGSLANERLSNANNSRTTKPPVSIIVPIYRRECFNEVYVGSHAYPGEGVYLLKFDNSYSIWRSKTLYYRVYYER